MTEDICDSTIVAPPRLSTLDQTLRDNLLALAAALTLVDAVDRMGFAKVIYCAYTYGGLSQMAMALRLEKPQVLVNNWMNGKSVPERQDRRIIADVVIAMLKEKAHMIGRGEG